MNIINIYSLRENNKDVMVLKYILNCLGFYVRELNDFNNISLSLLDIYIIYDNNNDMLSFLKNKRMDKTNSLFIDRCNIIDCYKYDKNNIISYSLDIINYKFLYSFIDSVFERIDTTNNNFIKGNANFIKILLKINLKYDIIQTYITNNYILKNILLDNVDLYNYDNYIQELFNIYKDNERNDLLIYNIIFAMYECNSFIIKNDYHTVLKYDNALIKEISSQLFNRNKDKEVVGLLCIKCFSYLDNSSWAIAANICDYKTLQYCYEAHYEKAKILRKYINDFVGAEEEIQLAIRLKDNNYSNYVELLNIYLEKSKINILNINNVTECLIDLYKILDNKYKNNNLGIEEYIYLYRTMVYINSIDDNYYRIIQDKHNWNCKMQNIKENIDNCIKENIKEISPFLLEKEDIINNIYKAVNTELIQNIDEQQDYYK